MTSAARPRVSIASAETGSVRADLSETADFTITASDQPTGTISVGYTVSETGNFITPVSTTIDLGNVRYDHTIVGSDFGFGYRNE